MGELFLWDIWYISSYCSLGFALQVFQMATGCIEHRKFAN